MNSIMHDFRFAFRQLAKNRAFTLIAVLTLALGIGATTAIFSVVHGVLLKPLAYPHSEQLVSLDITSLELNPTLNPSLRGIAPEDYFIFRDQNRTFQDLGIYLETSSDNDVNITGFAEPERVRALGVTDGVLSTLGVGAAFGRIFSRVDDSPGAPLTAVLTYEYWQRKFGANVSAVGKTIIVDGKARQIIGIMPRNFRFFDAQNLALILPLQLDRNKTYQGNFSYFGIGRLKPGSTLGQASTDIARMLPTVINSFPPPPGLSLDFFKNSRFVPNLMPLRQEVVGNVGKLLWVLMGSIGTVLLIACANVANLLLVRTEGRQHELTLRGALGASRRQIGALLLCECGIVGVLGSIFGLVLAWAALRLMLIFAPAGLPRIDEIGIGPSILFFAFALGLLTSLLIGLIPVFKYASGRAVLIETSRTVSQNRERHRARNILVGSQVALAVVLLVCSGLMIRTFRALTQVDPGFSRAAQVQTFRISIPPSDVDDDTSVVRIEQQIQEKLAAIPGVSSVAFSSSVPLDGDNRFDNVFAADRTYVTGSPPPLRHFLYVSPTYFQTLGVPLIAGRDLTWTDTYNKVPVALISNNFAVEYWRTPAEAIGKRIRVSGADDWREIIGVVGDVHDEGMDKSARTDVYWPVLLANFQGRPARVTRYAAFMVRSPLAGSETFINQIREAVGSVNSNLPIAGVHTLGYFYAKSMVRTAFTLVMLGIAGAMALLLGAVGLYGVIAYSVSKRTREIGIRMALGSQRSDVVKLILSEGMLVIAIGVAIGLAASVSSTRFMASLLFGVTATDPSTFAVVLALLVLVAFGACYVPARRAAKVDPIVALRYE